MSEVIDFTGVAPAADKNLAPVGTIDVFEITKVEFGKSEEKQTPYAKIVFETGQHSFNHRFYLTAGALPRLQTLSQAVIGATLEGQLNHEQIERKFVGKKVALKVGGKENTTGKVYPDLAFGGFCKPADKVGELSFSNTELNENERLRSLIATSSASNADTEGAAAGNRSGVDDQDF